TRFMEPALGECLLSLEVCGGDIDADN
ncbi:MAG: hypothetical protein RL549_997, partial [Verrucomicrobiota bacterium]